MALPGLEICLERSYLAFTAGRAPAALSFNPQERTEDDIIEYLHHPCWLLECTYFHASLKTLATDLSLQTNVTSSQPRLK